MMRLDWKEINRSPNIFPILPRHRVCLCRIDGDGKRFAESVRQVWGKIPLSYRRWFLKTWRYYRNMSANSAEDKSLTLGDILLIPRFELIAGKSDFHRGNAAENGGFAVANYSKIPVPAFAFDSRYMEAMTEDCVKAIIAHELAHCFLAEVDREHMDKGKFDECGFSEAEEEADDLVACWGFIPELVHEELSILPDFRDDEPGA